jgi:hypothetical protein
MAIVKVKPQGEHRLEHADGRLRMEYTGFD